MEKTITLEALEAHFKDLAPWFNEQVGRKNYAGRGSLYSWGKQWLKP